MLHHFLLAVYIEFKVPASFYINDILTRLFRSEYCFILSRKVFNLYARSKVMHTRCSNSKWCGVILCGYRFSFHSSIIPECTLQTFLATYCTLGSQLAVHYLVVCQITPFGIEEFLLLCLNTIQYGNSVVRHTIIVTPHHGCIISIWANDSNFFCILLQRQNVILIL